MLKDLYTCQKPSLIPDISKRFSSLKRTFIKDCTIPGGYSTEELKYFIIDKYREERSCLVIVNTKKDAAKLYFVIESYFEKNPQEHIELIHLSTMMCPAHRMDAIQKVKEKKKNILCISTQLIEAGVDISFGCVVRVIAGLDSIAQAAGRCNRHGEDPNGKNVYIVNLAEEDLSRLPDIKCGADITYRILAENPDDLLSPSTINRYYKEYFYKQTFQMSYRVKDYGNLYDLLSINNKGTSALLNKGEKNPPALRQAFQTAGELFSVIDQRTISVLVPYKDGAGLSKEYQHADINKKRSLLRQIGRYSVSLYHYQISKLNDYGALTTRDDEIFVLDSKYYSDKLGVVFDSKNNFLIV